MTRTRAIYKKLFFDKNDRFVVAQFPNVPIIVWAVTVVLNKVIEHQAASGIIFVIGTISLTVWALLELYSGVNVFRKILGWVVLFYVVYSVLRLIF